ncbi:hypothetical protein MMC29_008065 [Sticta canariensis]|nr:hypothetical protein [Sticta canariensis]
MVKMPRTLLPLLPGNDEERRYFSLFRSRTAPVFAGYYDPGFWDRFIIQISHVEPAVHHAVVALASLHETLNGSTGYKPGIDQYGLKQYNKSLAGLNRYMSTAKDKSVDIVLICCILFVTFDSLRGEYETAWQHLQSGLKILSSSRQDPRSSKFIHDDIVPVFVRLHVQAVSVIDIDITWDDPITAAFCVPKRFSSLSEARNTFYCIMSLLLDFCGVGMPSLEKRDVRSEKQSEILLEKKAYYASLLEQWQVGFDDLLLRLSTKMDSKDLSGAVLLKIHHITAAIILDLALTNLQCNFDRFQPQFLKIVSLAKSLIETTEATGVSPGSQFLGVDLGIIAPLYFVSTRCRDPLLRRGAAHLISSPRREGTWDAQAAATIAERVIAIEEQGLPHVSVAQDVPESSRVYAVWPDELDLRTHRMRIVFRQNATHSGDDTYAFEEILTWSSAPYQSKS